MATDAGHLRIGELSRRTGVSRELLRAWERRYGLLRPTRSEGGFRLYAAADERRIARMRANLERGLSAAEAAQLTLAGEDDGAAGAAERTPAVERGARDLRTALDAFDETGAHAALDRLLAELSVQTVVGEVVLPYLHELGERWASGEATVGHEHFASNVIRGRLVGLARGWDRGGGPRALLACPPGEQHDLALIALGLALRDRGWRVTFLGADTPLDTLAESTAALQPQAVVLAATTTRRYERAGAELRALSSALPLWIAGPGATPEVAEAIGARLLGDAPLAAADRLATIDRT